MDAALILLCFAFALSALAAIYFWPREPKATEPAERLPSPVIRRYCGWPLSETDGEYYRRRYHEELHRSIGRSLDLSMRIYELETENKRLAFRLRCAESLISVRALRGDLELDGAACDEGMGG